MKLHSDTLTKDDVLAAAKRTRDIHGHDIYVEEMAVSGSRSRLRGITLYAESAHGKRARNGRDGRAATWTAYGFLIAELFKKDPKAIIGQYKSPPDFIAQCLQYTPKGESTAFLKLIHD